jgi:Uma2 family endonuclease
VTVLAARRLITASEFTQMCEAGVFREDDRLELIEGEIIEMSPIGKRHAAAVRRLINLLTRRLGEDEALVDAQDPVVLGDISEPQPDLALLRPSPSFYAEAHPGPGDILLLIEVADSSLAYDREVKVPTYARYGVPEVWIADLGGAAVEVYRQPAADGYGSVERLDEPDAVVSPRLLPQLRLRVSSLVG